MLVSTSLVLSALTVGTMGAQAAAVEPRQVLPSGLSPAEISSLVASIATLPGGLQSASEILASITGGAISSAVVSATSISASESSASVVSSVLSSAAAAASSSVVSQASVMSSASVLSVSARSSSAGAVGSSVAAAASSVAAAASSAVSSILPGSAAFPEVGAGKAAVVALGVAMGAIFVL